MLTLLEFQRPQVLQAHVRPHRIVVLPPAFNNDLGFAAVVEPLDVKAFVAQLAIERFVGPVLPRLARIDQRRVDAIFEQPFKIAELTNSGPLSDRSTAGAPCTVINFASTSITRAERAPGDDRAGGVRAALRRPPIHPNRL